MRNWIFVLKALLFFFFKPPHRCIFYFYPQKINNESATKKQLPTTDSSLSYCGNLNAFLITGTKSLPSILLLLKHKNQLAHIADSNML